MLDDWVHAHAHGVLLTIEILWVGGFLAVFVFYFIMKRWFKRHPPKSPPATADQTPPDQAK